MVSTEIVYTGDKHCELTHSPSGARIETDAPRDNRGKGERFSPTDLMGAALGSCLLTTMAIVAEREGIAFTEASATVQKVMIPSPRRIGSLSVQIKMPPTLTPQQRTLLEEAARHCPVHQSLHPDVKVPMVFSYA